MKDIPGFEDRYAVTEDGRVWSRPKTVRTYGGVRRTRGRWLKQQTHNGYKVVRLGAASPVTAVHRYVALTYLPQRVGKCHINHINGDKSDNRVSNLEWTTQAENNRHALRIGLSKPLPRILPRAHEKIIADLLGTKNFTQEQIASMFGCGRTTVQRCVQRTVGRIT